MTHYATRAAALDRFLTEHNVTPGDVLSVSFDKYESGADIRVHIGVPVTGVDYKPQKHYPSHLHADVQREDLTIRVIHVIPDEAAA